MAQHIAVYRSLLRELRRDVGIEYVGLGKLLKFHFISLVCLGQKIRQGPWRKFSSNVGHLPPVKQRAASPRFAQRGQFPTRPADLQGKSRSGLPIFISEILQTLLERYNPASQMTTEERVEATARRVGLNVPLSH